MTSAVLGPALDQARTLKWVDGRLLVATRDLLFWNASAGAGERPTLELNVSWAPAAARGGDGDGGTTDDDDGINGVVQVKSEAGETMLVCTAPPDPPSRLRSPHSSAHLPLSAGGCSHFFFV